MKDRNVEDIKLPVSIQATKGVSVRNVLPVFIRYYLWSCWRLIEAKGQLKSIGKDPQPVGIGVSTQVHTWWRLAGWEDFQSVRDQPNKTFLGTPSSFLLLPQLHFRNRKGGQLCLQEQQEPLVCRVTSGEWWSLALTFPASVSMLVEAPGSGPHLRTPAHKKNGCLSLRESQLPQCK